MSVIKTFIISYLLGTMICITIAQTVKDEGSKQFIDHPDKNEYLLSQPGTDKHKYGYELKENKHFHHTTTELDGVRLGCYGYVLDGKKYSTQYVADIKGYRPVYTYDAIEVFPKSGGTREASFVRNFEEDTDRSGNLRYFFPEGCRGFDSLISPDKNIITDKIPNLFPPTSEGGKFPSINSFPPTSPPSRLPFAPVTQTVKTFVTQPPRVPKPTPPPSPSTSLKTKTPPKTPKVPEKYLPPPQNAIPVGDPIPTTQTRGRYVTKSIPPKVAPSRISLVTSKPLAANNACVGCCPDEENMPKIVIPIKLKNENGKLGSCSSYAKLILPADNVNVNSLKTNPSELAKMVLQSLA